MLAVRLESAGEPLVVRELPLPEPTGSQVRIRVAGCGICRTDLHIASGEMSRVELPITLGHEVAGWVDAIGPDAGQPLRRVRLRPGDAALVYGGWGCGICAECTSGNEQRCASSRAPGFQVDGGYAEAMLVPHPRHLVALGKLDPVRAAPLADAGLTPYRAVRRAGPWLAFGARALVVGLGGLGQFVLQYLLRQPNVRVAVRELDPEKVALASELGAEVAMLDGDEQMAIAALGGPADVVFDMVGTDATLELARKAVAANGLIMLVGEAGGHLALGFDAPPVESWVTTTAWGSRDDLAEVVRLARRGALHWNVETMRLAEASVALGRLAAGQVMGRIVLVPER
jgi:propanol-preferring alcohol dehydrogenase